jgi:hypothetical protein
MAHKPSRIWAGVHFPAAEVESKRLASLIVHRALSATPPAVGSGASLRRIRVAWWLKLAVMV